MLKEQMPSYLVPGVFTFVDKMPLNSSGKTDKNGLKLTLT
jgi:acyl-CoA synthetase (AMP-forming)/AMP-acid ligase II